MTTAVGIDLGTTNSAIAVKRLTATLLRNREGQELTPSCVTALPDGTFAVGRSARDPLKQYPQDTLQRVADAEWRSTTDSFHKQPQVICRPLSRLISSGAK